MKFHLLFLVFCLFSGSVFAEEPDPYTPGFTARDLQPTQTRQTVPGNLVLHEINEPFTQVWDSDFGFYRYSYDLVNPLTPLLGYSYWISVQAKLDIPPQWMWAESGIEYDWGQEGVFRSEYHGIPEWITFSELSGFYSELAFRIYSDDGLQVEKLPIVDGGWWSAQDAANISYVAECADDFYYEGDSPITRIEWWGGYTASPVMPQYFHVRIYGGEIVPTRSTTWGQVKLLY